MNHPATFVLPLSAGRVLDVLHSLFRVGELIAISQDEIARRGYISEASVSRAMPVLVEHGFIEREKDPAMNGGRGGYWLRLLPLPDMEGSATDPSANGSTIDPLADEAESRDRMPDSAFTASPCGTDQSLIPGRAVMVHDSKIQEEESARPLLDHLLTEPGMNRSLAQRIAAHPIGTVSDFAADLRIARTFAKQPFYFTVAKWRDGQRVIAPKDVCHERPARSERTERASRPGTDSANCELDPHGVPYPKRGPIRTQLTY